MFGNHTTYRGNSLVWSRGKCLVKFNNIVFEYDGRGRRIKKNGVRYYYDFADRLIASSDGMQYFYDHIGVAGFKYNGVYYTYKRDIQGNVIAILDSNGSEVVQYNYNAWGEHTVSGTQASTIGAKNPFRYRSYFYDTETGLYFLKTRYYDPQIGRFINMDSVLYADPETINGLNLYTYCGNNPVMYIDPNGNYTWLIFGAIGAVVGVFGQFVGDLLSGEWSSWQEYVGATVGGFVAGVASTLMSPLAASIAGSLAVDATTLALNLITGQETRTNGQIITDVVENVVLTSVFAIGSSSLNNSLSRSIGPQLFRPLTKSIAKVSVALFFKELTSEMISGTVETIFDNIYYRFKKLLEVLFSCINI